LGIKATSQQWPGKTIRLIRNISYKPFFCRQNQSCFSGISSFFFLKNGFRCPKKDLNNWFAANNQL
jgi:hypothetical protein